MEAVYTHGPSEPPFAKLMYPRPFADTIHIMHGRVARHITGVLNASGKNDGYTGMYIVAFINVHLSDANTYSIGQFSSAFLEKRKPILLVVYAPGTSRTELRGPVGKRPGL